MDNRTEGGPGGSGDLFELSDAILRGDADIDQRYAWKSSCVN